MTPDQDKTVLWFSGGKDSMACLYMIQNMLPKITVIWANTGKYYPEALETINKARALCPNWLEVTTDRDAQWSENGLPSDLVPVDNTKVGQSVTGQKEVTVQSYLQCRMENISLPLWNATKALGATLVIRGQRKDEAHRATTNSGDSVDGIQFWHPIETWSKDEVLSFLRKQMGELPEHYALDHTSMDCYDCTAYAAHSHDRVAFTKEHHPALHADYMHKLALLHQAIGIPYLHYSKLMQGDI